MVSGGQIVKTFHCHCGAPVFFDNHQCLQCESSIGFDPQIAAFVPLDLSLEGSSLNHGVLCDNGVQFGVCNWVRSRDGESNLCVACQFNRTIPNLALDDNIKYWMALEHAKRRLIFTLMVLKLPLQNGWDAPGTGLLFDFLDDERSKPDQFPDTFVTSGHSDGLITVNVLEANDIARATMQSEMLEPYRTLLGHFRHESGHYYWTSARGIGDIEQTFREVFGDPTDNYADGLQRYYESGPKENWSETYISAYASSHPLEDWAETWGHYLHIYDALETAHALQLIPLPPTEMSVSQRVLAWQQTSMVVNEMNRSIGGTDAYPFTISPSVVRKLEFVDVVIDQLRAR